MTVNPLAEATLTLRAASTSTGKTGPMHVMNPLLDGLTLCGRKPNFRRRTQIITDSIPAQLRTQGNLCTACLGHHDAGTARAWRS